jgi:hypothetical protein
MKTIIPVVSDKKEECDNCRTATRLTVQTKKGIFYLCSDNCRLNFNLKTGMSTVNQIRHKDGYRPKTIGKLNNLSAEEIKNLMGFSKRHDRHTMNRLKQGDSLERMIGIMSSSKKISKVSKIG